MKKTILIAFELDDNGNGENLDTTGSKFFQSLLLDKIKFNGVSIKPIQIDRDKLIQIEQTSRSIRTEKDNTRL